MSYNQERRPAPRMEQETPEQAAQKHNRVLLHALQTAHPVLHEGKARFIHTLNFQIMGGSMNTTVYLTGDGDRVPLEPSKIQLQEQPK